MLSVHQLAAFNDNYIHILLDEAAQEGVVIDPGDAEPVLQAVAQHGWHLTEIWATHHHADHVGGAPKLQQKLGLTFSAAGSDARRLAGIDRALQDGDRLRLGRYEAQVLAVPGHTSGHLAYWFEDERRLFCGDTLFALGCGRLFEGSADEMWHSLSRFKNLPGETLVYCAHEYTLANARFALSVDPGNPALLKRIEEARALRDKGLPTVPFRLDLELETNPFLRADRGEMAKALGLDQAPAEKVFAALRKLKDDFK
ncbi:MAG: hydroxyacylglutathione hydrolase [Alphaproteobacteria bacterium]|nr:hydroxyacylglutathione hydrolase [Alphaproteobacteria bacterium]